MWKTAFKKFEGVWSASNFFKGSHHKFYLVHSWILCPICFFHSEYFSIQIYDEKHIFTIILLYLFLRDKIRSNVISSFKNKVRQLPFFMSAKLGDISLTVAIFHFHFESFLKNVFCIGLRKYPQNTKINVSLNEYISDRSLIVFGNVYLVWMVIAKSFHLIHRQRVNLVIEYMSKDIRMRNMEVKHVNWNRCSEI